MVNARLLTLVGLIITVMIMTSMVEPVKACDTGSSPIIAGQNEGEPIGKVEVHQDIEGYEGCLAIFYKIQNGLDEDGVTYYGEDWSFVDFHLAIEEQFNDIPMTNKGNPKVGQFEYDIDSDYLVYFSEGRIVVIIPYVVEGDHDWESGDTLYVAAHAVVEYSYIVIVEGQEVTMTMEETAWADTGNNFPGTNWALYFTVTLG